MSCPAAVHVRGLSWWPADTLRPIDGVNGATRAPAPVLDGVDLDIDPGERVLLAGPSGAGKSTLLRALAGLIDTVDEGELHGDVQVQAPSGEPSRVGLVLQEPGDAVVAARVGRDVAFGPENLGLPREQIWQRVYAALAAVGFPYDVAHLTAALSGGQLQRLALAGALAWGPGLLLLDEPTSMLDPQAADQVRTAVAHTVADRSITLVVVDHDLAGWVDLVDRLVVLDAHGHLVADIPAERLRAERVGAGTITDLDWAGLGLWVPGQPAPAPLSVPEELVSPRIGPPTPGAALVSATDLVVTRRTGGPLRGRWSTTALHGVHATVSAGQLTALTGASGAGKSTLVETLAGLLPPDRGMVAASAALAAGVRGGEVRPWRWRSADLAARVGWVPQRPEHAVVTRRVVDEVTVTGRQLGRLDAHRSEGLLEALGLTHLREADPLRLSGGEARRLALAAAVAHGPAVLALDEPTVGQDRATWAVVAGVVRAARQAGVGVVLASHDERLMGAVAPERVVRLEAGRLASPSEETEETAGGRA